MNKFVASFIGAAVAAVAMAGTAVADPIVMKVGYSSNGDLTLPGASLTAGLKAMQNYLDTESHGQLKLEIYPNGQLGNARSMVESAQTGSIQMVGTYASIMVPFVPEVGVTQIPYIFDNNFTAWKVAQGSFGKELSDVVLKKTGLRVLGWVDGAGFREIYTDKPIKSAADLKGMTMRVPENPGLLAMFRAWGAKTVTITWAEIYTGLQSGMAQGCDTELYSMYSKKLYEVNPYITMTNHSFNYHLLMINDDFFQSLSPENQKLMLQASDLFARVANAQSEMSSLVVKQALEDKGATFYYPTAEQLKEFKDLAQQPYIDTIVRKIGADGQKWVDKILAAGKAAAGEI